MSENTNGVATGEIDGTESNYDWRRGDSLTQALAYHKSFNTLGKAPEMKDILETAEKIYEYMSK